MSETLTRTAVPSFESVDALCYGLDQKGRGTGIDLYPRDGTRQLFETEQHVAALSGADPEHVILQNNGMAALREALDVAVEQSGTTQPKIAIACELYPKTIKTLERYATRHGLSLVDFNSGSIKDIDYTFENEKPDIFISETVGNGPNVPVLNHEYLIRRASQDDKRPSVILDHTLPLSSGYDVFGELEEEERVLVVVSGTKSYSLNAELSGITFVKNPEYREALRSLRCDEGGLPGVGSTDLINRILPESKKAFDTRNQQIYKTTGELALHLDAAQYEEGADFFVRHPGLESHPNYVYSSRKNGGNITPVFYIHARNGDQKALAKRLESHPDVVKHAQFSQSFGFDEARILPDAYAPVVRIAGGAYTDTDVLGNALYEAILKK
jgi:cystathionine beta-lyase/cystathionine gamma-synthase